MPPYPYPSGSVDISKTHIRIHPYPYPSISGYNRISGFIRIRWTPLRKTKKNNNFPQLLIRMKDNDVRIELPTSYQLIKKRKETEV
jgi:hypothetical protein